LRVPSHFPRFPTPSLSSVYARNDPARRISSFLYPRRALFLSPFAISPGRSPLVPSYRLRFLRIYAGDLLTQLEMHLRPGFFFLFEPPEYDTSVTFLALFLSVKVFLVLFPYRRGYSRLSSIISSSLNHLPLLLCFVLSFFLWRTAKKRFIPLTGLCPRPPPPPKPFGTSYRRPDGASWFHVCPNIFFKHSLPSWFHPPPFVMRSTCP